MKNIAIFASGGGSNARKIIEHFAPHPSVKVALVVANKADAGVLPIADAHGIPHVVVSKSMLYEENTMAKILEKWDIEFIVLAGYLLLMPAYLTEKFSKKIVNIHPALLPKFGGKGMYGSHVHTAVKEADETETGITIHFCNAHYDEGDIIFQAKCAVKPDYSAQEIAAAVLALEHFFYPKVIESLLTGKDLPSPI